MGKSVKKTSARMAVAERRTPRAVSKKRVDGVVIAKLVSVAPNGVGRVLPAGSPPSDAFDAVLAARLTAADAGADVAVVFEGGDPGRPIVIARIERLPGAGGAQSATVAEGPIIARLDGETVILEAAKEIVLRCGDATITLTRAGKILIQGAYVSSRSSGVNRIRGGAVQIN